MDLVTVLLGIMILLGIGDLIVGVSNDAANFMNSAVASKVASLKTIMIVVSLGVMIGAFTSSGMMEVARKGIFNPQFYTLNELIMLCLAVMLADILLLDLYNTFGLPTSTTVSLVFELLGAALVLALFKAHGGVSAFDMINSGSALKIISGIFLSVLVAFLSGMILQFVFRLFFTYDLQKTVGKFGGAFAGLCIALILTFIMIKGLKNADFMPKALITYIKANLALVIMLNFVFWAVVFQILVFFKVHVFKIVILLGTGGLAMAFAGNDLVNFIGVPIAALTSYDLIQANFGDGTILGTELAGKFPSPTLYLFIAGTIMAVTLWFSRKARNVQKTEISLGSENEKVEIFQSNNIARLFVQSVSNFWQSFRSLIPAFILNRINARFETKTFLAGVARSDYDHLRASVNIMTASAIIMAGTLMKLPLSTTFITFMVAMGTSFADRAWGRDNAVQRVSGVLTVIGGWFMTAMIASMTAGIFAAILYNTGMWMGIVLFALVVLAVLKLTGIHREREAEYEKATRQMDLIQSSPAEGVNQLLENLAQNSEAVDETIHNLITALGQAKRKPMRKADKEVERLVKEYQHNFFRAISYANSGLSSKEVLSLHNITKIQSEMRHVTGSLIRIKDAVRNRLDLYTEPLSKIECEDIDSLQQLQKTLTSELRQVLTRKKKDPKLKGQSTLGKELLKTRADITSNQLKRIKEGKSKIKSSIYYLILVDEMVNINQKLIEIVFTARQFTAKKNKK